jgi:hypothetical protein
MVGSKVVLILIIKVLGARKGNWIWIWLEKGFEVSIFTQRELRVYECFSCPQVPGYSTTVPCRCRPTSKSKKKECGLHLRLRELLRLMN